ncbi:MAG: 3-hydroxybutyryl-CoA dehydrogenase [Bacillaceae bacterium]|nr:3-hydroxybutyryl-CoA dehydrogenase [Bacillaceae bacterium]
MTPTHTEQTVKQVGVVGSGIMGSGIAQVCVQAGYRVVIHDIDTAGLKQSYAKIIANLEKWCHKHDQAEQMDVFTNNLIAGAALTDLQDTDIVIEAVTERLEVKQSLFCALENVVRENAILASNTSGLSVTEIASACTRPQRVVGTHFFNPAPVMPLVEVIQGEKTDDDTINRVVTFIERLNKKPIKVKDVSGFVVNRIITPMLNEAMHTLEAGIASREDIDEAIKLSMRHPMGPLALSDYIGLDTLLYFMESAYQETGKESLKPSHLLKKMVAEGHLGVKTGKGFYEYYK